MTRLGQAGFGLGDSLAYGADTVTGDGAAVTMATSSPTPRSGAYCCKCSIPDPSGTATWMTAWHAKKTFAHASKTEVWYGLGVYAHHAGEGAAGGSCLLLVFHDASGNVNVLITLDSGILRAYVATAGGASPTFAQCSLLGAASSAMSMDAWHLLEVRILAATGATGAFELYLDGTSVVSVASVRTAQSSAALASFALTTGALQSLTAMTAGTYHAFADVRYQDTLGSRNNGRVGDEVVRLLVPDGPGSSAGMTRGGTDSGANWSQTEEVPPSLADYVFHATAGTKDLYAMSSPGALSACSAVQAVIYAQNSDAGAGSVTITVKTPAGEAATGAATPLSAAATYYRSPILETDPTGGAVWDAAKLAALECGVVVA